jgi:ribosomal-protein-alanine N-acetyltransferase
MSIPFLIGPHLTLRPLLPTDAARLHAIYQEEGVLQYFPNPQPPPLERVERFIEGQQKHWAEHSCGNWGILAEGNHEILGWAGLQYLAELDETEVGFLLARPFWGRGFASEAARLSLQFGFETLDLEAIIALVHPGNAASLGVVRKCGLQYVETIPLWGMHLMLHRVSRSDWRSANGNVG